MTRWFEWNCRTWLIYLAVPIAAGCFGASAPQRDAGSITVTGRATVRIGGQRVTADTYAICLPDAPTQTERTAASELQLHLRCITAQTLPIVPETDRGDRHGLFVGRCKACALEPGGLASLGTDGILIRTHGPDLQLVGNRRGVLYAVSVFLEDYLGCRWFTPDCTTYPTRGTISVPVIDRRYVPALANRATDYPEHRDTLFAMRNRFTSANAALDAAHGGKIQYYPFVHSFNALVPPAQYFDQHPEYFALVGGQRRRSGAQFCLTNPDVLHIAIAQVRKWIAEAPESNVISVSQNDIDGYCECERCSALAAAEGSQSGPILHFVNAIADAIRVDYPDIMIDTLAYRYSRKPPLHVRPASNVTVRLCSIECCFSHPLATCPENAAFMADLRGWSAICDHLSVWDYGINYAHTLHPFPNLYVLQPNVRTYVDHGVRNLYEEANYFSRGGEMAPLRTYILAKVFWDPAYDPDKAIDEFVAAYYGKAGPYVRRYIDLVHAPFKQGGGKHVRIYDNVTGSLSPTFVEQAQALFHQARAAVQTDPVRLRRVRLAQVPVMSLFVPDGPQYRRVGDALLSTMGDDIDDWTEEFRAVIADEKITHNAEGQSIDTSLAKLPHYPSRLKIERLQSDGMVVECLPAYGGRILNMRQHGRGARWTRQYDRYTYAQLRDSSELYSGVRYESPGWSEAYDVVRRTRSTIIMRARLASGLELEREVSLGAGATVHERVTLRNTAGEPREATLRINPPFVVRDARAQRLLLRRADGQWQDDTLPGTPADDPAHTDRTYNGAQLPAGAWGMYDIGTGQALIDHLRGGTIERCFTHMNWVTGRLTLELWSPTRTLAPGDAMVIEHEYEFVDRWSTGVAGTP